MRENRAVITTEMRSVLIRILCAWLLLSVSRLIFYFANTESFPQVRFTDWLAGAWFDFITLALWLLPYCILAAAPVRIHTFRLLKVLENILFAVPVCAILVFNLIDTRYFHFTQKRSTADLFGFVGTGNDVKQLLGTFLQEFWWLVIIFLLFLTLVIWFMKRTRAEQREKRSQPKWYWSTLQYLVFIFIIAVGGRGGFGLKPITVIDTTLFTSSQNSALVLNSGFTILKTFGKSELQEKNYFQPQKLAALFQARHQSQPQHVLPDGTNVMIVILEGIGQEFIGAYNDSTSYTPFLDSLIGESWHFRYGMANGKKSIEGIPAITAGLPTFMDNPYISSSYGANSLNTIASVLKENGYSSGFYHGATNGSMRFNSFAAKAGYDVYFGRKEYNNEKHADASWGILDEYFEPRTARELSKLRQPFVGTMFTLSSHHPWYVPQKWRNVLPSGPYAMCQSIAYGDLSLRLFFREAKKQPWYQNTLFVIVADHSNPTYSEVWSSRHNMYKIPIVFFHPGGKLPKQEEKEIFQQIDIMPTLFDLLNIRASYWSIGHSWFSDEPHEATAFLEGSYYYFNKGRMLTFANDQPTSILDFTGIELQPKGFSVRSKTAGDMTARLKAIIQTYNQALMHNEMTVR